MCTSTVMPKSELSSSFEIKKKLRTCFEVLSYLVSCTCLEKNNWSASARQCFINLDRSALLQRQLSVTVLKSCLADGIKIQLPCSCLETTWQFLNLNYLTVLEGSTGKYLVRIYVYARASTYINTVCVLCELCIRASRALF